MLKHFLTILMAVFTPTIAFAHHPLDGATPETLWHGLASGIFHPIIGLDHLAFILAVGILAVALGYKFLLPAIFIASTIGGTVLHIYAVDLFQVEFFIALSLVVFGTIVATAKQFSKNLIFLLTVFFGLFHGHAYGEAVYGAEPTPIFAYLFGFAVVQYILAIVFGTTIAAKNNMAARFAGAMVLGAGSLLVGEHILSILGL